MKKILIAYDGSAGAKLAVKDLKLAGLSTAVEAKVLTIADVWIPPAPPESDEIFSGRGNRTAVYEKASEVLRDAKKTAIQGAQLVHALFPNWTVTNAAKAESPAWGIIAEGKRWRADLIVIGSHGRTPLEKFFLGSVSFKVAAEANCSVRVMRPRDVRSGKPLRILIGLDGSSDSHQAVQEVLERQWPAGTAIDLVAVIDPKLKSQIAARSGFIANPHAFDKIEDAVQSMLEAAHERLTRQDLNVQCHIFEGDPKRTLLHKASDWEIDCIFLGARGTEHCQRLYLGTLASAICTRAHCTVEIVRAKASTKGIDL